MARFNPAAPDQRLLAEAWAEANTLSSYLMTQNTVYRNRGNTRQIALAEVGYIAIAGVAVVETASSLTLSGIALAVYPISPKPFKHSCEWLSDCSFSLRWSLVNCVLNPFVTPLVADEASVRIMVRNRDFVTIPDTALL